MDTKNSRSTLPEQLIPVNIEDEMRQSYLDYAMSVIVGRALPDVRDGLKPVHRRVLYAMHQTGNTADKQYRKSAKTVGEVIGKFHPHGDSAVYDTIVRMAQDFALRYPLIDGQGNFGSIDGDPPAAMRYTEIRMSKIAATMLADIDKETVDFGPNYDGSEDEPLVMPARLPNLLVNGSTGIAVGMATNIPPHNLGEISDAIVALIDDPEVDDERLFEIVPGPDFPTAGFIHGRKGIRDAYSTGRGVIQLRARAVIERSGKGGERESIIVTELPYQVNKARLIEKIAELVRHKKIEGIADLRDESDREGMRIVVDLKRDVQPKVILNQLYKHTQMQTSFGIIMLAIVDRQPRVLKLREVLREYLDFRREVIVRRTRFELAKAQDRAHILEGLKIALDHIDQVIALIRKAPTPAEAKVGLVAKFGLSEVQAQAILEMRLQRLTGLERDKILAELAELLEKIARYQAILADEKLVYGIIRAELLEVRAAYSDERRSEIIDQEGEFDPLSVIADEDMVITISNQDYIKRNSVKLYRTTGRNTQGANAMETKEEDFVKQLFIASTHSYVLFFSTLGRLYWLKVHEIEQAGRAAKGKAIVNLLALQPNEKISAVMPVREFETENRFVVMATAQGVVKKTALSAYANPRAGGIIAINIDEGDALIAARITDGKREIFLATARGKAVRFDENDIRTMGRVARGVTGIRFKAGDRVVGMEIVDPQSEILTVTEKGYGKRTEVKEYRLQGRGGQGTINLKVTDKNGPVVGVLQVREEDEVMVVTKDGKTIRTSVKGINRIGRATQGVIVLKIVDPGDQVASIARLLEGTSRPAETLLEQKD
ncbi:MAG: DNA gyrase subunit A [Candidatus Methylomirabilia bacterium]